MARVDHQVPSETVEKQTEISGGRQQEERGREADVPRELPKLGWRDILWRTYEEVSKDNISLVAAGVAFYLILALVPALGAVVSIYGHQS